MTTIIILGAFIALTGYFYYSYRKIRNIPDVQKSEKIQDLTDKNFQYQVKNGISLVDFWASWCVPCKMMAPVLNELAEETSDIKVCKVNVEQYHSLANKYAVRNIPTMLLFRNGKEIDRFVGVKSKDFLLRHIQEFSKN